MSTAYAYLFKNLGLSVLLKITNFEANVLCYSGNSMVLTALLLVSVCHSDWLTVRKWNSIIWSQQEICLWVWSGKVGTFLPAWYFPQNFCILKDAMLRLHLFENLFVLREIKNYKQVRGWKGKKTHKTGIVCKGMRENVFIVSNYGLYFCVSCSFNPLGLKRY